MVAPRGVLSTCVSRNSASRSEPSALRVTGEVCRETRIGTTLAADSTPLRPARTLAPDPNRPQGARNVYEPTLRPSHRAARLLALRPDRLRLQAAGAGRRPADACRRARGADRHHRRGSARAARGRPPRRGPRHAHRPRAGHHVDVREPSARVLARALRLQCHPGLAREGAARLRPLRRDLLRLLRLAERAGRRPTTTAPATASRRSPPRSGTT